MRRVVAIEVTPIRHRLRARLECGHVVHVGYRQERDRQRLCRFCPGVQGAPRVQKQSSGRRVRDRVSWEG